MKYKLSYVEKAKTKKITSKTPKETARSNRPQPFSGYQKWPVNNRLVIATPLTPFVENNFPQCIT